MADDDVFEPEWNGNRYLPFADMIAVEKIDAWTYTSIAKPFAPGAGTGAFGGHVYAQAVYAASKTLKPEEGRVVCNVSGVFTRPGSTAVPFIYHIRPIQDGTIFAVRYVEVRQRSQSGRSESVCFTCTATFKREEADHLPFQEKLDLRQKYAAALGDKKPRDWPACPAVDSPWFWENLREHGMENNPKFPGLYTTKVDMDPYNAPRPAIDRRQLQYYSVIGPERLPSIRQDPNLHAAAHLYASDRNSLFALTNLLGIGDDYMQMASLSHTVIFHTNPDAMSLLSPCKSWGARAVASERGLAQDEKWFCEEAWVTRNGVGRCLRESKIWDDRGIHVATSMQDGLVRLGPGVSRGERIREDFEKHQSEKEGRVDSKL